MKELEPFINLLKLNTGLFNNCFEGVDEVTAALPASADANPMIFIALHILEARYYIARILGVRAKNPFESITSGAKKPADIKVFPPVAELLNAWNEISEVIVNAAPNVDMKNLGIKSRLPIPIEDKTRFGEFTFLVQHESYHIGQLGLYRKLHGLSSMSY